MVRLLRSIRLYIRRNATILTWSLAILIVSEGIAVKYYPGSWWKPLLVVVIGTSLLLTWRNMRVIIKAIISITLTMVTAFFGVSSGYYYTSTTLGAVLWGMGILVAWSVTLSCSYFIRSTRSRWGSSLAAAIISYIAAYLLMMIAGIVPIIFASILIGVIAGILILLSDHHAIAGKRAIRPLDPDSTSIPLRGILQSLWPKSHIHRLRLYAHGGALVSYGPDQPSVAVIPVSMDEPLRETRRHGLTYHGRDIRRTLQRIILQVTDIVREPSPAIILVDVHGVNDRSEKDPVVLSTPLPDSSAYGYVVLFSGCGANNQVKRRIARAVARYDDISRGTARSTRGLDGTLSRGRYDRQWRKSNPKEK